MKNERKDHTKRRNDLTRRLRFNWRLQNDANWTHAYDSTICFQDCTTRELCESPRPKTTNFNDYLTFNAVNDKLMWQFFFSGNIFPIVYLSQSCFTNYVLQSSTLATPCTYWSAFCRAGGGKESIVPYISVQTNGVLQAILSFLFCAPFVLFSFLI